MEKRYQQKQTRDIPTSKTSRPKSFDAQRSSYQAKDAGPSRPHTQPEAPHRRTSSTPDLTTKQGDLRVPKSRDRNIKVQQSLWKQRQGDYRKPNSRQKQPNTGQYVWPSIQGDHAMSNLGGRSFNASRPKDIPALTGGGGPDDSSSQQQTHNPNTQERVYAHERSNNEAWTQPTQQYSWDRSEAPKTESEYFGTDTSRGRQQTRNSGSGQRFASQERRLHDNL